MPIVFLAPDPVQGTFLIPGGNTPGNGVQLFCYVAGSVSTKQNMYTTNTGTVAHPNPLILDAGGNIPNGGVIWIPQSLPAKFLWAPATDSDPPASPYRTIDNVSGINDTTTQEWITGPTPTFVNASSFTMAGDQTGTFKPARRLKFSVTAGTVYGAVGAAVFATSTTVSPVFSSGSLDAGLTAVSYSLVGADPSSINADYIHKKATAVPSAGNGTTNIWSVDGDYVHVTGTNTIAHFSSAPYAGAERTIIFDGALSINPRAALNLAGGNVTTAANDRAEVKADTVSTSIVTFYQRASGIPLQNSTSLALSVFGAQASSAVLAGPTSGAATTVTFRSLVGTESALVLLATSTAAVSAQIDFNSVVTSAYDAYELLIINLVPATDNTDLWLRGSTTNGASFTTSTVYSHGRFATNSGTPTVPQSAGGASDTKVVLGGSLINVDTICGATIQIRRLSGGRTTVSWQISYVVSGTAEFNQSAGSAQIATNDINALRVMMSSGNVSSGTFRLYGKRSS